MKGSKGVHLTTASSYKDTISIGDFEVAQGCNVSQEVMGSDATSMVNSLNSFRQATGLHINSLQISEIWE